MRTGEERAPNAAWGKRIYREGILPSGKTLRASVQGDLTLAGVRASCASCHRRSGFGSSEGASFAPPITAADLFEDRDTRRVDLFRKLYQEEKPNPYRARVRDPRVRPAYTDPTLAAALREGRDPSGRILDPTMPRYQLDDEDMAHLIAYLRTVSAEPSKGVDGRKIHFATVITPGTDPGQRQAMQAVLEAYFRWKNADTARLLKMPGHSPWFKDDYQPAYREWALHSWELRGAPSTWEAQLEAFYRQRPVFALLSGMGAGPWRPIHRFCERRELPCLFPHTVLPEITGPNAYSLYFSKGLFLEAEALAVHLRGQPRLAGGPIIQVYREGEAGAHAARALDRALAGSTNPRHYKIPAAGDPQPFWKRLMIEENPRVLVLWLEPDDLATLPWRSEHVAGVDHIFLSRTLLGELPLNWPDSVRDRVRLIHPYLKPGQALPRVYRIRSWLRSRGVARTHEGVQLKTYFACSILDHALTHMVDHFFPDYLIEFVEHEAENALNPGVYPHMSLGPGQRFASKGAYILKYSPSKNDWIPDGQWIVP